MRALWPVVRNNASLMIGPASAFGTYLILAKWSASSVDDLYFFLLAVFSICAVIDGGLPYRGGSRLFTPGLSARLVRRVLNNVMWSVPALAVLLFVLILRSPYGRAAGWPVSLLFCAASLLAVLFKVQADALRVATYKSVHRMRAEAITSAFAVVRLLGAALLVNRVPFLFVYLACVAAELAVLGRQQGVPLPFAVLPRFRWRIRPRFDLSYLRANIAYNVAYNADRLVALYVLPSEAYRLLVGVTSLYNMAILPHKLSENEALFPSSARAGGAGSWHAVPPLLSAVGAAFLCVGLLWLLPPHLVGPWQLAIGVAWVALTTAYNHSWALALRQFNIAALSRVNGAACVAGLVAIAAVQAGYSTLLPLALLVYGAANWFGALLLGRSPPSTSARYLAFCAAGALPVVLYSAVAPR